MLALTQLSNYLTLKDSFSAVSKPNSASIYSVDSFESSHRDLHNTHICTDLMEARLVEDISIYPLNLSIRRTHFHFRESFLRLAASRFHRFRILIRYSIFLFLFSSIHFQCFYRPVAQSIYLSIYLGNNRKMWWNALSSVGRSLGERAGKTRLSQGDSV